MVHSRILSYLYLPRSGREDVTIGLEWFSGANLLELNVRVLNEIGRVCLTIETQNRIIAHRHYLLART